MNINKKTLIIAGGIIVVLLILISIKINQPKLTSEPQFFTEEPETWVEEVILTDEESDVKINVMKATGMKSSISGNLQEYYDDNEVDAFFSHGSYKGYAFETFYVRDEFYDQDLSKLSKTEINNLAKEYAIIEITPELNPNDGIIQGFIMAKKDDNGFIFYIFVDEDWKNDLEFTNILYGQNFNSQGTLLLRNYNFDEIKPGVYMDKIEDYNNWYEQDPISGGIMVGEINIEDLSQEQVNSTFIILR